MRDRAIVVGAFGPQYEKLAQVTHPPIKAYAERIGADFVRLPSRAFPTCPGSYEKLQLNTVMESYERTIWLDSDILVRSDTPSLFDLVPYGTFGALNEWPVNPHWKDTHIDMTLHQGREIGAPVPAATPQYFNGGVLVADRTHQDVFAMPKKGAGDYFQEQCLINFKVWMHAFPFKDITQKFNHLWKLSSIIDSVDRFDEYIIHYFGLYSADRYSKERGGLPHEEFLSRELVEFERRKRG